MRDRAESVTVYVIPRKGRGKSRRPTYYLRYVDPQNGETVERSARTLVKREAERQAAQLAQRIEQGQVEDRTSWRGFCQRYERDRLPMLDPDTLGMWITTRDHVDRILRPKQVADLTEKTIERFMARLLKEPAIVPVPKNPPKEWEPSPPRPRSPATVAAYLRTLKAALRWELKGAAPKVPMPPGWLGRSKGQRSRPLSGEDWDRVIDAAKKRRPQDYRQFVALIYGIRHSGLRFREAYRLSWHPDAEFSLDADAKEIRIRGDAQKNRQDQSRPITPEFWGVLESLPRDPEGWVFRLDALTDCHRLSADRVQRIVNQIGKRSNVVVRPQDQTSRGPTSTDLGRRAFSTALAQRTDLSTLEKTALTGHADPATLYRSYYARAEAKTLKEKLWATTEKEK